MRFTATLTGGSIPRPDEHWSTPFPTGSITPTGIPMTVDQGFNLMWGQTALDRHNAYLETVVFDLLCRWVSELEPEIVWQGGRIIGLSAAGHGVVSVKRFP